MSKKSKSPETIQQKACSLLHALFGNDKKKIFPFLRMAVGPSARSSKEVLGMSDEEARKFLSLLRFFVKELRGSKSLNDVVGEMHRHYLWHDATKEQLRILLLMRRGQGCHEISRLLRVSVDWVRKTQFEMVSKGASLGRFSYAEDFFERNTHDAELRNTLAQSYDKDLSLFAARMSFLNSKRGGDLNGNLHLAAYYAREMLAKALFGSFCDEKKLVL